MCIEMKTSEIHSTENIDTNTAHYVYHSHVL